MPGSPIGGMFSRMLASGPSGAGARVMGTGIVSIALLLDGAKTPSRILLVIAGVLWAMLVVLLVRAALSDRARLRQNAWTPASLTWVAGSAVVGTRLALLGWRGTAAWLLVLAVALWIALIAPVLAHWRTPTVGGSLLVTVATQSLAVLAVAVGSRDDAAWLLDAALVPFGLGLCSYAFVMARFDLRELWVGHGDQWIAGGALAISTLAVADLTAGARALGILGHGAALEDLAVGLWVATMVWLPVLVVGEVVRPWRGYEERRWSTVFPLGMYAVCSFVVGAVAHADAIKTFAQVWAWIAAATWVVVFVATVAAALSRRPGHPAAG
jgi:tellurite resistance protein TehA-like permease